MLKQKFMGFDWFFLLLVVLLGSSGVLNIYSAASSLEQIGTPVHIKQIYWLLMGMLAMIVVILIGYQRIASLAYPFYFFVIACLVGVLLFGRMINGAQRWLAFSSFMFQPSELARISVLLLLAHYFYRRNQAAAYSFMQLIIPFLIIALPCLLIFKQPDLGTTVLVFLIGLSVLLVNRVKLLTLVCLVFGGIGAALLAWFKIMKDYQKQRVLSFLFPDQDPLGAAYNQIQSKIAVGSGQFTGKGFMAGTQGQLHFLPEQYTDFAYSVLAEEWGFIGASLVAILILLMVFRGLILAYRTKDTLGILIIAGCTALIFWPSVINMAMVTGVFPVTGMPLPFISYGGSSLVTTMGAIGLIQSVNMRRYVFNPKWGM